MKGKRHRSRARARKHQSHKHQSHKHQSHKHQSRKRSRGGLDKSSLEYKKGKLDGIIEENNLCEEKMKKVELNYQKNYAQLHIVIRKLNEASRLARISTNKINSLEKKINSLEEKNNRLTNASKELLNQREVLQQRLLNLSKKR